MPPKVFISYSHDSKDHAARVLALADALCRDGIDVIIDQYEPVPKEGWPHWMENNLDDSDFILMICTSTYLRRVKGSEQLGIGLGVHWEGNLIYNHIYENALQGKKYLPILLDGVGRDTIPMPVKGHTNYHLTQFELDDDQYQSLYRHLTGQPATPKPVLGGLQILPSTRQHQKNEDRKFEKRYLAALAKKLDRVELFIERQDVPDESRGQELTVAYVTLELNRGRDFEAMVGSIPADALFDVLPDGLRRVLVVGPAGCGKTTLLRWIGLEAARPQKSRFTLDADGEMQRSNEQESMEPDEQEATEPDPWQDKIPFLIRLRDCKDAFPIPKEYHRWGISIDAPEGWAQRILDAGRGILLLDGLDELAPPRRLEALEWIEELTESLSDQNVFVVSSRPQAVKPDALSAASFSEFGIRDLSPNEKVEFVKRWHEAVRKRLGGKEEITVLLTEKQERLLQELKTNRSVSLLASNPLLCALLCALNRVYQQSLPENLRDLCESACKMLLWDRDQLQNIAKRDFIPAYDALTYLKRLLIVQNLAHNLVKGGESQPVLSRTATVNIIAKTLHGVVEQNVAYLTEAEEVMKGFIDRSGLLRECGEDEIEFVHNSLRDYLASLEFVHSKEYGYLVGQIDSGDIERWEPVLLFASATASDYEFGKNLLKKFLTFGKLGQERIHKRELLALKVAGHISFPLGDDLDTRINEIRDKLLPIDTVEKVKVIAEAGEIACEYLAWQEGRDEEIIAACVRGLGSIDGNQAHSHLAIYLERDHRPIVLEALFQVLPIQELAVAINVLQIPSVVEWCTIPSYERKSSQETFLSYIRDLTPLSDITQLKRLYLNSTAVSDMSPLSLLTQLELLDISDTFVTDVSPLSYLTQLMALILSGVSVSNVFPLSLLTQLELLNLSDTFVRDVTPLSGLTQLIVLNLSGTLVSDVSSLSGLAQLKLLNLSGTSISDISCLSHIKDLRIIR